MQNEDHLTFRARFILTRTATRQHVTKRPNPPWKTETPAGIVPHNQTFSSFPKPTSSLSATRSPSQKHPSVFGKCPPEHFLIRLSWALVPAGSVPRRGARGDASARDSPRRSGTLGTASSYYNGIERVAHQDSTPIPAAIAAATCFRVCPSRPEGPVTRSTRNPRRCRFCTRFSGPTDTGIVGADFSSSQAMMGADDGTTN